MSSEEDFASPSSEEDDDDDDFEEDKPKPRPAPRGRGGRGRGCGRGASASASSRRNPRRYTTAEMEKEISTYTEKGSDDDDDGDDDGERQEENGNGNGNNGGGSDTSSSIDSEEELRAARKLKEAQKKKKDAIIVRNSPSPIRKPGYKRSTVKTPPPKKAAKTKKATKKTVAPKKSSKSKNKKKKGGNGKQNEYSSDDSEEEDSEASSVESPDEDDGGAWDENASDAGDSNVSEEKDDDEEEDSDSDSDFGAPQKRKPKRGAKGKGKGGKKKTPARSGRGKARAAPARATRAPRYAKYEETSSEDEEEIQYETTPSGSRRPRRQCKTATQQKMHKDVQADMQTEREAFKDVLEEDDRELLEIDNDEKGNGSDSSEEALQIKRPAMIKKNKYDEDESYDEDGPEEGDNDDDDDDDDEDENMSDFVEEEESDDLALPKRRSTRKSSRKQSSKRTNYKDVDASEDDIGTADEDSGDAETGPSILMSPARKSSTAASYGSPKSRQRARARQGRTPLDLKEDRDMDSDDSDSDFGGGGGRSKKKNSNKKGKPKKKRMKLNDGGSDDESGSDYIERAGKSEDEESDEEENDSRKPQHALIKSPYDKDKLSPTQLKTTHINCPSTIDDITMSNLPKNKPHVCYIAPDGKTRHCFTLDTLYRIAISSNKNDDAADVLAGSGSKKLCFLQPPHFRSTMEDDLLDQIGSRFGRGALDIEKSVIYRKMKGQGGRFTLSPMDDELDEFDEDGNYVGYNNESGVMTQNFQDRFERYMQNLMGSQDIYCCPLCYNESDRRLGNNEDEEMCMDDENPPGENDDGGDENGAEDRFSFLDDPLTILGSCDNGEFDVASTFCFRLLKDVKNHLKVVHGIDIKGIAGNDLFKRFQIRASDGLLQSWLRKSLRQNTVQGDMMRYWLQGENQSFVLLLNQIDKKLLTGEQSGEYGSDFSFSFPNRAKRIWRDVSAPYLKEQDLGDFLAEEGEEEEEGDDVPINPHFTPPGGNGVFKGPEEQMLEHLERKKAARQKYAGSSSDDSSEDSDNKAAASSDEEGELEVLPKPPQYEAVEEEDEWTKRRSYNAKVKAKSKPSNGGEDSDEDSFFDTDKPHPKAQINGSAKKRVIGDENGVLDSGDEESKPKAKVSMNGSARKRVLESSDEESD